MWWPGTELNRRRQPFQGCALPPELPGHFLRTSGTALSTKRLPAVFAVHWALLLGGMPRSKTADALGTVRNLLNYSNPVKFLKIVADDSSLLRFLLTFFSHIPHSCSFSRPEMAAGHAVHDGQRATIRAEPVGDLTIVARVKHSQVGVFTRFHAAKLLPTILHCSVSCSHSFRTFLIHAHSHDQRWPLGTPFMTVSAQRFAPNQ